MELLGENKSNIILFELDFNIKFSLLHLLQLVSDLKVSLNFFLWVQTKKIFNAFLLTHLYYQLSMPWVWLKLIVAYLYFQNLCSITHIIHHF